MTRENPLTKLAHHKTHSLRTRARLLQLALFRRYRNLPHEYVAAKTPPVEYGWGNFFDLFPQLRTWPERPRPEFAALCKSSDDNYESSEMDTAQLLYDLTRLLRAKRVIEVGIYRGAGSLHLAQGISDNGGGELHLVDLELERLEQVSAKIQQTGMNVQPITHCGDCVAVTKRDKFPMADFIFLDANHFYLPLYDEIGAYWALVAAGGLLAIHDTILFDGARRRANELFENGYPVCTIATSLGAGISLIAKR